MTTNPWNRPDDDGPDARAGYQAWQEPGDSGRYANRPYAGSRGFPGGQNPATYREDRFTESRYGAGGYGDTAYARTPAGQGRDDDAGRYDDGDGYDAPRYQQRDDYQQPDYERGRYERGGDRRDGYGSDAGDDDQRDAARYEEPPREPRDDAPKPNGRAGRNLPAAIGVGLGLGAVLVASLLFLKVAFVVIVGVAVLLGLRELSGAMRNADITMPLIPVAAGAVGMVVAAYTGGPQALVIALALTVFVTLVWRMAEGAERFLRDATAGVFAAVYVPFLASFAVLLVAPHDGPQRALLFLILTVCSDTGGYAAGVLGGRHPMAPRISPKKSWEGLAGSVIVAGAGGAIGIHFLLSGSMIEGVITGLAAVASATLGDLIESVMKRDIGVKDMGTLLPGHGGIMDRLDSLLATAPVVWLLLTVFVPPS